MFLEGLIAVASGTAAAKIANWEVVGKKAKSYVNYSFDVVDDTIYQLITNKQLHEKKELVSKTITDIEAIESTPEKRFMYSSGAMFTVLATQTLGYTIMLPVNLFLIGFFATPIFESAYNAVVKEKKVRVDILDSIVISMCLVYGQVIAAAFMIWILDVADMLLEKTTRKSRKYVTDILGQQSNFAWLVVDGTEIKVSIKELQKGDIIAVSTGEEIAIDGVVTEGQAMINQQSLTGEANPVDKKQGDKVFAATMLVSGYLKIKVLETGENTLASKIIDIINDASNYKAQLQSKGEKFADQMVIPTLALGGLGYATSGVSSSLAIINADYGTGIRVASPIALLGSLGIAAKNGILIKDGRILEVLPEIDTVLFDKTGTVTYETPEVSRIIPLNNFKEEEILFYTAVAEQKFTHPIAAAILKKAKEENMDLPSHGESEYRLGLGIQVSIGDKLIKIGSLRYIESEGIEVPTSMCNEIEKIREEGDTTIFTIVNNQLAGMITLKSRIREEISDVIRYLREERKIKEIVLISGDHEVPTQKIANELNMDRFFAGVLPQEKADYVKLLQDEGKKVMMIGDGINDSGALSCADIAISLKGASTIAVDVADVVFMDGSLTKFEQLFQISNGLRSNVKTSFALVLIPNTVCIAGALFGVVGLSTSLVLNNGFNIISAINGSLVKAKK